MWIRITEEMYLPSGEIVGFFGPGVLAGKTQGADENADDSGGRGGRADALMRDGEVVPMPFRLKAVASRIARAAGEHTTSGIGE